MKTKTQVKAGQFFNPTQFAIGLSMSKDDSNDQKMKDALVLGASGTMGMLM